MLLQEPSKPGVAHVCHQQGCRQRLLPHRAELGVGVVVSARAGVPTLGDVELAVGPEVDRVGGVVGDRPRQAGDDVLARAEPGPGQARDDARVRLAVVGGRAGVRCPQDHVARGRLRVDRDAQREAVAERGHHLVARDLPVGAEADRVDLAEQLADVEAVVGAPGHRGRHPDRERRPAEREVAGGRRRRLAGDGEVVEREVEGAGAVAMARQDAREAAGADLGSMPAPSKLKNSPGAVQVASVVSGPLPTRYFAVNRAVARVCQQADLDALAADRERARVGGAHLHVGDLLEELHLRRRSASRCTTTLDVVLLVVAEPESGLLVVAGAGGGLAILAVIRLVLARRVDADRERVVLRCSCHAPPGRASW